jgi:hypothetical protein
MNFESESTPTAPNGGERPAATTETKNNTETKLIYPIGLGTDPKYAHYISFYIYEIDSTKLLDQIEQDGQSLASIGILSDQVQDGLEGLQSAGAGAVLGSLGVNGVLGKIFGGIAGGQVGAGIAGAVNNTALFNAKYGNTINVESEISVSRQRLGLGDNYKKIAINIHLPMPPTIETNYGFEYSDVDMTTTKQVIEFVNALKQTKGGGIGSIDPSIQQALAAQMNLSNLGSLDASINMATDGLKSLGVGLGGADSSSQFQELSLLKTGQIKAPYTEKLFKNVSRRNFELKYKFSPRSFAEAMTIYQIIRTFKVYSHPAPLEELGNDGANFRSSFYLKTPSEFKVKFMYDQYENYFLPKYGRLVLTSIEVTYGSDDSKGFSSFRPTRVVENKTDATGIAGTQKLEYGAFPTEINMSLKFEEMELLTRERMEQGW